MSAEPDARPREDRSIDWWGFCMSQLDVDGALQPEDMIARLCQVDLLTAQGLTVMEALKTMRLRLETYRRWRGEIESLMRDEAIRLRLLEAENAELRRVLSDLTERTATLRQALRQAEHGLGTPSGFSDARDWQTPVEPGAVTSQK